MHTPNNSRPLWYALDEEGNPDPILDPNDPRLVDLYRNPSDLERAPRRVAISQIGEWRVSTVFLALDHAFGDGPPVLWETMVFGPEPWDDWTMRYTSKAEAQAGHALVVESLIQGKTPEDIHAHD
jgi:hypothetical protein